MKGPLLVLGVCLTTASALYSKSDDVIELTSSNFDKQVKNSKGVFIVEFYAPWCGHCKQLAPEYKKAAKALKGLIGIGAVDCDEEKSLCGQYSVSGFPTIKVFTEGKPKDYNGQRTSASIIASAQEAAQSLVQSRMGGKSGGGKSKADVVELTESNFKKLVLDSQDMWLVEFFAPWCGHCKNLEPHWKKAAKELKGKVKLGAVDATVHASLAQQYGVQGYPTIKYFPAGVKKGPENYEGGRTAEDIVNWAMEKAEASLPPPELVQLTDQESFKANCEDKPLCVISFLPHILDCQSKCRNKYIKTLKAAGEKFKRQGWGWVWSEAGAQGDLENSMDVGGFGYPAMSVLSHKKMKYSTLTGSFGQDGINEFLRDLSYGKGRTNTVKGAKVGAMSKIDPWDGKDGEMPVEEDIDLSDVELEPLDKDEL